MSLTEPEFLHGGGEMGVRMRSFDWTTTPLGEPARWPQSLKTIVRMMLDSRFAMWMAWGPENTFFCNDAYLPTVGLKRDWVLGARADRVWAEVWDEVIVPRRAQVYASGEATWDEGLRIFLRRHGYDEETFHTFSYSPVHDDAGRIAGMLCVVTEDTERVIGERRLALLNDLSTGSHAEAASLDEVGRGMLPALVGGRYDLPFAALYLASPPAGGLRLVGTSAPPRRGALPPLVRPDAGQGLLEAALSAAMAEGREQRLRGFAAGIELGGPWPEALREARLFPLASAGQPPIGCLLLGVSTRRTVDAAYHSFMRLVADQFTSQLSEADSRLQAEQRAAALAELDHAKNVFFSNVSHEFRTPLTLILGPIDRLLTQPGLSTTLREELTLVRQNGARLHRLVNSLLDFSRIEAGRVETRLQATDLPALTADLASVFRAAIEDAGLRLRVHCEPRTEPIHVDPEMWEKVVLNLLSNALKFTFEGEIEVALRFEDGQACLSVRDTGIGIGADELPRVFDRFHRIEGVRSRSQEGSGIGLALVKELVRLHEGSIEVSSEPGRGTVFTVRVPLRQSHLPQGLVVGPPAIARGAFDGSAFVDDALRGERSSYQAPATMPAFRPTAGHRSILVVDDNADMRAYIQRLLAPVGTVLTASDGQTAWDLIAANRPDLVVTDAMMPRLDGFGLIQRIRSDPATQSLPVVMLSAQAGEEAAVAGLIQGADDYLIKPFSAAELMARVEVLLLRDSLRQAENQLNKRLADVFRSAPVGVAILRGPNHVFEFTNAVYQGFIGERVVLGRSIREALPEMGEQGFVDLLDRVHGSGEVYHGHAAPVRLLDPATGQLAPPRHFEFVYQPLPASDGLAAGIAVICFDVDEVVKSRAAAEAANRAKDEFIAMLGHELRNPLAPIFTALQVMALREPASLVREREIIARQAGHLARLVDDLLDVARISRGNVELKQAEVELATVFRKALEMSQPLIEAKRQLLGIDVPAHGLRVHADAARLAQVISNLLTNAAKFTGSGGAITAQARAEGGEVVLDIRDTGVGMTPQELESVFELFVQGRQGLNRAEGGLGLGLTISRNLVRLHGGSLQAASEGPGRGSLLTLRLPRLGAALGPRRPEPVRALRAPVPQAPRRVLLVDDNRDAGESLAELLRQFGHEVVIAEDGPRALKAVENGQPFDVALLDIGLPVMSGYELAQLLRQRLVHRPPRLVALTGYGLANDREKSRDSGFDDHLVKPVDLEALLTSIGRAGGEHRAQP